MLRKFKELKLNYLLSYNPWLTEISDLFPCHTRWRMVILITKDDFWILMDIVIADLIHTDMVQWTSMMTSHVAMMVVQEKTWSYVKRTPSDDFIPFDIERYGCFHSCFDSLLIACAQTTIVCHQRSSLVPSMLVYYYW
jgi:hypothetical protein